MEPEVGIKELVHALPLEERVPVLALKTYFDQRSQLDEDQENQIQKAKNKFADKVKPLLDRVILSPLRLQS